MVRGHPGNEGDHGRLVPLADDAQRRVSVVNTKILDVGGGGLAHPQAVETQQNGQSGMVVVIALGGEEERAELGPVQAATLIEVDLGPTDILGRVSADPAADVGEAVEATDSREAPVDGRRRQSPLLHRHPPQLDVDPLGFEHLEPDVGAPLEERPQVVAVCLECPTAIAGEIGARRHLGLIEGVSLGQCHQRRRCTQGCHHLPPCLRKKANTLHSDLAVRAQWDDAIRWSDLAGVFDVRHARTDRQLQR
jgi:hypothetical protein